jgi:hypothetical protein
LIRPAQSATAEARASREVKKKWSVASKMVIVADGRVRPSAVRASGGQY